MYPALQLPVVNKIVSCWKVKLPLIVYTPYLSYNEMDVQILQEQLAKFKGEKSLSIVSQGIVQCIPISEITHLSEYGRESVIYTRESEYRTSASLKKLLMHLPAPLFFRIHRSHIISLQHMKGMKKKRIGAGRHYLPVSAACKRKLLTRLQRSVDRAFVFFDEPVGI